MSDRWVCRRGFADNERRYASMISPSEDSWPDGDRTFTRVLYDPDDAELTSSLRGAAR